MGKKSKLHALQWKPVKLDESVFEFSKESGIIGLEEIEGEEFDSIAIGPGKILTTTPKKRALSATSEEPAPVSSKKKAKKKKKCTAQQGIANDEIPVTEPTKAQSRQSKQGKAKQGHDPEISQPPKKKKRKKEEQEQGGLSKGRSSEKAHEVGQQPAREEGEKVDEDMPVDMAAWAPFGLHERVLEALKRLRFSTPTAIQEACLPAALQGQDIVGAAETGSGKTLAFMLPVVDCLLHQRPALLGPAASRSDKERSTLPLFALVITPTRELAMQCVTMTQEVLTCCHAQAVGIVGGIAVEKQLRLLRAQPEIVVGTPGRLWELMSQYSNKYLNQLQPLRFFVLDEADRMVDGGHFQELHSILELLRPKKVVLSDVALPGDANADGGAKLDTPAAASMPFVDPTIKRQTFLFSATLTLPVDGSRSHAYLGKKGPRSAVDKLYERIEFQNEKQVIDISRANLVAGTLKQSVLTCVRDDKEALLFLLLSRYSGRSLVFVNAISCLRRVAALFGLMGLPVVALHANMQQRQRIKNLERFKAAQNCVLIATDVAARGLDIQEVEYVVHFQIPTSSEVYVHRSGRAGRAFRVGWTVALVDQFDMGSYKKICHSLHQEGGLPDFPEESQLLLKKARSVLGLATKIDKAQHSVRKTNADEDWYRRTAAQMDIVLDEDLVRHDDDDDSRATAKARWHLALVGTLLLGHLALVGTLLLGHLALAHNPACHTCPLLASAATKVAICHVC